VNDSYFNAYAKSYDEDLQNALSVSGEDKNYFALGRMRWLAGWLHHSGCHPRTVLDFGCGTGSATPFIHQFLKPGRVLGVDVSLESLRIAGESFHEMGTGFEIIGRPHRESFDVAFCNGVFHHITPGERQASLDYVFQSLRPGGIFALFENNPWNPATRYVMSRCAFDRDAVTLPPPETRQRMKDAGFQIQSTRYLFVFPAFLKALRFLESPLEKIPLGAQYVVVGRKSISDL
jgi:SAM-dependent methyltransferase